MITGATMRRTILALVAVALCSVMVATGAQAHTTLVSSTPADGAVITTPSPTITLTFASDLLPSACTLSVNDSAGNVISSQQVQPAGAVVSMPWPSTLKPGSYEVAYRVVASDGHPVIGAIHFTFQGASPAAETTAAAAATPAAASPSSSASSSTPAAPESTTSTGLSTMTLGIILLAVLVVFGFVLTVRRRKQP